MRILRGLTYDVVLVFLFAAVGRLSHGEDLSSLGATAWPFVSAAMVGSLVAGWSRGPWWSQALIAWAISVVGGILLRVASGQGAPVSFIVTTALILAVLLVGWRALLRKQL